MAPGIVHFSRPVTLLGGGEATPKDVKEALRHAPNVVAADGGASLALEMGLRTAAVIGDMDSLPDAVRAAISPARLHRIREQDSTDFDKCLRNIAAPLVLGVGFTGKRLDHQLAAFSTLLRYPGRRCILLAPQEIIFLAPPRLVLQMAPGQRVSLFPMVPCRVAASGVRWSFEALDLAAGGRIGTSNEACGGPLNITTASPGLLVLLPRATLGAAIAALLAAPVHEPPPGA